VIADAGDVGQQPHFLCDIIAETRGFGTAGAVSTSVGANPYFLSQKARVGPAMPAPLISTFMGFVLT
jgi:hypothetical protein